MSSPHQLPRSAGADDELTYEPWIDDDEPLPMRDAPRPVRRSLLESYNLTELFGPTGALAAQLYGYETRPSQIEMAEAVKRAILSGQHALIEAPTGTGKSIAYLAPAILSGQTVVVSTANKSLQSQLFQKDIPFLRQVLGTDAPAVVVKGRSNFVCTLKWRKELQEQRYIELYDRADTQVTQMRRWLDETETGDVDELPFLLSGDLRPRIVSFPDDCLHTDCIYYEDDCWVNRMRDAAAEAQILVTNHHLLLNALELGFAGQRILPPASLYVIDEAHHLEQIATSVYETVVSDFVVEQLLQRAVLKEHVGEHELDQIRHMNALAFRAISDLSRDSSFKIDGDVEAVLNLGARLGKLGQELKQKHPYKSAVEQAAQAGKRPDNDLAEKFRYYELTMELVNSTANKLQRIGASRHDDAFVRYAVRASERRSVTLEVHAAPINPADLLARYLFHPVDENDKEIKRTVICTSATLATAGGFAHYRARCGIRSAGEERILPAVFDYPQQALLYQPALPAYNFREASNYYDAVAAEIERLLEVSRGRALCLFTSWSGLQQVNDRLQATDAGVVWPLRAQGDAPRDALVAWFKETPNSVLLATRSFWEGLDIPGDDLSLVVLDKMPFPTPSDPLHGARMRAIEEDGRSSFDEYMLPLMTLALKQGFGRLIRRSSDRGVVAILDERLSSKGYGRQSRRDLPAARFSRDFRDVHRFYQTSLASAAEFALNVWATTAKSGRAQWRWQLVRLQDGRAEGDFGAAKGLVSDVHGELHAGMLGLADLRTRVERAGRPLDAYTVELRCSPTAAAALAAPLTPSALAAAWAAATQPWRAVTVLPTPR
jgi:ATP-dependent DNA helicase DinG